MFRKFESARFFRHRHRRDKKRKQLPNSKETKKCKAQAVHLFKIYLVIKKQDEDFELFDPLV